MPFPARDSAYPKIMDSAGFLALWDAADEHHVSAVRLQQDLIDTNRRFLTTDYVVDETVTLLLLRRNHSAAVDFLGCVRIGELTSVAGQGRLPS